MARRLVRLAIDRVDLVDKGANQKASIVLTKRQVDPNHPDPPKETSLPKNNVLKSILSLFAETDVAKRDAAIGVIAKQVEEGESSIGPVHKEAHDPSDPNCDCDDCLGKRAKRNTMNDEVQKRMDVLEKRATDAELEVKKAHDILKAEREVRLDREMTDVLKTFKVTSFNLDTTNTENDIKKFRKMQDADPSGFARTLEILKSQDAAMSDSIVFKNVGSGRPGGPASALAQLEAAASDMISKSATPLTKEQAFEKASLENPKLVAQYRAEQQ